MSVMDLSSTVTAFVTGTYSVTRAGVGSYVDGVFFPDPAPTTVQVSAGAFPLSGRELLRLPEGLRTKELRQVFTVVELRNNAPGVRPDVISIDGELWQVETVEDYSASGNFFRSVVSKVP